jgi:hypothetical protein
LTCQNHTGGKINRYAVVGGYGNMREPPAMICGAFGYALVLSIAKIKWVIAKLHTACLSQFADFVGEQITVDSPKTKKIVEVGKSHRCFHQLPDQAISMPTCRVRVKPSSGGTAWLQNLIWLIHSQKNEDDGLRQ